MNNSWWHNHITGKARADRAERADRAGQYKVNYLTLCLWISMPYTSKKFLSFVFKCIDSRSVYTFNFTVRFYLAFSQTVTLTLTLKTLKALISYLNVISRDRESE